MLKTRRSETKHLEVMEIANLLSDGSLAAESCRHLAETCPTCRGRLAQVESLMARFRHWDAETVVREGLAADDLFEALLTKASDPAGRLSLVKQETEYQTWGIAWV